jgi:hypothetical protein
LPLKYGVAVAATILFVVEGRHGGGVPVLPPDLGRLAVSVPVLGAIALGAVRMRASLETEDGRKQLTDALTRVAELVPRTRSERRAWVVASVSANVTEEATYRAFALAYLNNVFSHR